MLENYFCCHSDPFVVILSAAKNLLLFFAQGRLREESALPLPTLQTNADSLRQALGPTKDRRALE
ncbi:MAG: hypothetical protein A3H27_11280 [Acidobacteria bacterium RIFCSPLOWO2_02_FULL_59_13]|nr:MAG: hypothetical protein A3H27_11280 [Acidobacteria bacterium RIFCSPLOWO2_02_FULL_59_13]